MSAEPRGSGPVTDDLADPQTFAAGDRHDLFDRLRGQGEVVWQPAAGERPGFWSAVSLESVTEVLRDHRRFTAERGTVLAIVGTDDPAGGRQLAVTDPPRHTAMRARVQKLLSPRSLQPRQAELDRDVAALVEPLRSGEVVDVAALMSQLPMTVAGPLLGVPRQDRADLAAATMQAVAPDDPTYGAGRDREQVLRGAHLKLFAYFQDLVEQRRRAAADDVVSALVETRMPDGAPLGTDEIVANCYGLVLGSVVTTPHVICAALLAVADRGDLGPSDAAVEPLVDEALRWASPARHFMRYAVADTDLGGVRVRAGDAVVAWIAAANRDPAVFERPHVFDPARQPNRHIAFGAGPHYCVGHAAARLGLTSCLSRLRRQFAGFRLAGEPRFLQSSFIGGLTSLPMTATPTATSTRQEQG